LIKCHKELQTQVKIVVFHYYLPVCKTKWGTVINITKIIPLLALNAINKLYVTIHKLYITVHCKLYDG